MSKKTIDQVDVAGKRVLARVDFNVPLENGEIVDDRRIRMTLPTIRSVADRGGRLILMSHLGRPKGTGPEPALSLRPIADRLGELCKANVSFPSDDCVDEAARSAVEGMSDGDVVVLENLRFHNEEKAGDAEFARKLAAYGEIYCNDAFGTCHRTDASMVAVADAMEGRPRVSGLLLKREIEYLGDILESPAKPFVAVLGGAKVSDKIKAVDRLLSSADHVLIGGAMAYTFLEAMGTPVGESRVERDRLSDAKHMLDKAGLEKSDLHLPEDHVCSTEFSESAGDIEVFEGEIKPGYMGLDIGSKTQGTYASVISKAKTIVWAGPMGVFEWRPFRIGTQQVAHAIAEATKENGATSIVGGGDTAAAAERFEITGQVSHVSTGGGASLALLSGERLEALERLDDA